MAPEVRSGARGHWLERAAGPELAGHADLSAHERYLRTTSKLLESLAGALPDLSAEVLPRAMPIPPTEISYLSARISTRSRTDFDKECEASQTEMPTGFLRMGRQVSLFYGGW
jgi:hypothetical protein